MPVYRARVLTPVSPDAVRLLDDALVEVDGTGRVAEVLPPDGRAVDEDLRPGLLTPGFVDAHLHHPQTRIVGAATGELLDWLDRSTFPEEVRCEDQVHAAEVARIFCRNLAASGTTLSFAYGSVHPGAAEALLATLADSGLRAIAGPVLMDEHSPAPLCLAPDPAIEALAALADRWDGYDARLRVGVIPRFALSCSKEMLVRAGALARERHLWVSTHLSENPEECRVARERFGTPDYLRIYEDAGLVHDRTVLAHCVHLSDAEWDRLAGAGAVVAHCPDSNFFLGSGRMPIAEVLSREIPLAVGSDVAAGRSFRVPRILSGAFDNGLATGVRLDPRRLFWWGTRGGALALGEPRIGRIEHGSDADLVLHDLPEWARTEDQVLSWLLFDHDAPRPRRTWVRGRVVWERDGGGYPWS